MAKKKKEITIEQAVSDCRAMFNIPKSALSKEDKGKFFIHKQEFERGAVISKLMDYFENKVIIGGQCAVEPITLLWTVFTIGPRQ